MARYLASRIAQLIPVLFGISVAVFILIKLTPGDPAAAILGVQATPVELARVRAAMGLDQPFYVQFFKWLWGVLQGDLGVSYISKKPVVELIMVRFPATLQLSFFAMLVGILIGVPSGIISATRRYTGVDFAVNAISLFGVSVPAFWLGIMFILIFSLHLGWLPASGYVPLSKANSLWQWLQYLILPAGSVGLYIAGAIARFSRSSMLETMKQDYIRTARAKGLSESRVILIHALKNSMIPVVTVIGLQIGLLLGGAVITEQVFAFPGVGWLALTAISQRDYPVVQGVVLLVASLFVVANLLVDVLYTFLNPRIRYS